MGKEGYPRFWGALWAPLKGFYWFEGSARNPIFEEPEPAREIMRTDVLGEPTVDHAGDGLEPAVGVPVMSVLLRSRSRPSRIRSSPNSNSLP
jgi:hypothetical protein